MFDEKVPKFTGKKNDFPMWSAKAKAYLAMKFLGPTLLASFKDTLPANEHVVLDKEKPEENAKFNAKKMNLHAMNLLTVMMAEDDLMLMMVDSVKSTDWPDGLAYVLWEKLLRKFKPSDQVAKAEQTAKLLSLKLKKGGDPSELELKIASIELSYGIPLNDEMKIAALLKAAGHEYSDTIRSETRMIERAGGTVTYDDLIQAMTQSFRIYGGKNESDESDETVLAAVTAFKGSCNFCGKEGHKATDCPNKKSVKCENCGKSGHKKEYCWELESNKSRQPAWHPKNTQEVAATSVSDGEEIIL